MTQTPAVQALHQRLETGEVSSCTSVSVSAQPFFAVLLRHLFPDRPIVVVTEGLKTQESFQQDVETWLKFRVQGSPFPIERTSDARAMAADSRPLFYPAWEALPHEAKLPHADIISERLETLVALSSWTGAKPVTPNQE